MTEENTLSAEEIRELGIREGKDQIITQLRQVVIEEVSSFMKARDLGQDRANEQLRFELARKEAVIQTQLEMIRETFAHIERMEEQRRDRY